MKLKLNIEELSVDSFEAAPVSAEAQGTVRANASDPQTCYPMLCATGADSCGGSCDPTCGMSCWGTCIPAYCTGEES